MTETASEPAPKWATGIAGFDEMAGGGLPAGRITLLYGQPGTGKTVFTMQTLAHAASQAKNGLFVCFEESADQLMRDAAGFEWSASLDTEHVTFIDADVSEIQPVGGSFDLSGLIASIQAAARETATRWVVLDGLDMLLDFLPDPHAAKREFQRLKRAVTGQDIAVLVTSKAGASAGQASFFDFFGYLADCVIDLRTENRSAMVTRLVQVLKYRGSDYAANAYPFVIESGGIRVLYRGSAQLQVPVFEQRVSSGHPEIDELLGGGWFRGSTVLISGLPGTAKTTLSALFAEAAAGRGERVLFICFDEGHQQATRNARSIGCDLQTPQERGRLRMVSYRTGECSAHEHLARIQQLLDEYRPNHLIVDPVSALSKAGGPDMAAEASEYLSDLTRSRGVTTIMTSLLSPREAELEATDTRISTIADAWINLGFGMHGGERNRSLTIIKARGTPHSNQLRELILSAEGIRVAGVYTSGDEVLMGTARLIREAEERSTEASRIREAARERDQLKDEIRDTERELNRLSSHLDEQTRRLENLEEEEYHRQMQRERATRDIRQSRGVQNDESERE